VADHLERSANSVLFNMAEGIGAYRPKVKIASYDIARREGNEVRGALRRLVVKRVFTSAEIRKADGLAGACIGMLTRAIITLERQQN
jgi:four helix bundle protein